MKKILLTGAAGFIGAETAQILLAQGHQVVGIDNLNDYYSPQLKLRRLEALKSNANFQFFPIDIEDAKAIDQLFSEHHFSAVMNIAARAGVRASIENPHIYMSTNAAGTLNLLEAMVKHKVGKLVLSSTSSLYAGQPMPFLESLPVNTPISPYAASKKAAEIMAYTYHHIHGIDVSVVRYFTVFGPAGRPDMMIYRSIDWVLNGRQLQVFGDGSASRDFTFVTDIARGTVAALKPLGYEIINLGGGNNPISIINVINMIEEMTGKNAKIDYLAPQAVDMSETWADISKAKNLLNWQPEISFEDGLEKTVRWHTEENDFLQNLAGY